MTTIPAIKKAYFDTPAGQIHYRTLLTTHPSKKEPCVFLHMSACSSAHYEKLMTLYAARGHDCCAPDMPGFGNSFDPVEQPPNTGYYVSLFLDLFQGLGLGKFHLFGHHSGASLAIEIAALHPSLVLSLVLCGAPIMTPAEQKELCDRVAVPFNEPVRDGSHLVKTWEYLSGTGDDVSYRQRELIDHARAWKGRLQIYRCVFGQDVWGLFERIEKSVRVMALCARDDVLWPYFHYVKEIRPDARSEEVKGGNYSPARDSENVARLCFEFMDTLENI